MCQIACLALVGAGALVCFAALICLAVYVPRRCRRRRGMPMGADPEGFTPLGKAIDALEREEEEEEEDAGVLPPEEFHESGAPATQPDDADALYCYFVTPRVNTLSGLAGGTPGVTVYLSMGEDALRAETVLGCSRSTISTTRAPKSVLQSTSMDIVTCALECYGTHHRTQFNGRVTFVTSVSTLDGHDHQLTRNPVRFVLAPELIAPPGYVPRPKVSPMRVPRVLSREGWSVRPVLDSSTELECANGARCLTRTAFGMDWTGVAYDMGLCVACQSQAMDRAAAGVLSTRAL